MLTKVINKLKPYVIAVPLHELGHIIAAGGIVSPYFRYAPEYDPFVIAIVCPQWSIFIALAGLLITLPLLLKYRSSWLLLWLVFLARHDIRLILISIVRGF